MLTKIVIVVIMNKYVTGAEKVYLRDNPLFVNVLTDFFNKMKWKIMIVVFVYVNVKRVIIIENVKNVKYLYQKDKGSCVSVLSNFMMMEF